MTKKSKFLLIFLAIMCVLLITTCSKVFAASTTYSSYIDMLVGNTTLTGSSRQYNERNHEISFYVTELSSNTHMFVSLSKDGWFGSSTKVADKTVDFDSANRTYTYAMGNHDTGKYHYYFSTFGVYYGGAFYADPVNMKSYD